MNKTLPNPYYLFSFQHIASKERISFYPQVITSNIRYDKFRFVEAPTTNLSATPPEVFFEYLGQYYYSIYENITSGSTDISLAYNKLESGRAWVIVGDDNTQECFFEPYISNDEDFAQVIYVSDEEEACIYPSQTPGLSPTPTPSITPTITPSATCPITTQYLEVELSDSAKFKLALWNDAGFTSAANANCDYIISGCAYGDLGTVYCGTETIPSGAHQHQFNLSPVLLPGEAVSAFTVSNYTLNGCVCPVNLILPGQPTPTPTNTPTITPTPSSTPSSALTPASLGALWWIDFTNTSSLGLTVPPPLIVSAATDLISSVVFGVESGNAFDGPNYLPTQYLGVSGATQENVSPLVNPMGTYTSDYTGFTWFGLIYDDNVSQAGGCFIEQYEGGFPAGFRTFMFRGDASGPLPENFIARVKLQSGADLDLIVNPIRNAWTQIGIRAWEEGGDVYLEVWENGSLLGSTSQPSADLLANTDAEFRLMFDGGIDYNTEQFWFNRKLNDTEMGQMFSYLTNKY